MAVVLLTMLIGFAAWWAWEKRRRRTHPVSAGHRPEISLPFQAEFELYHNALSLCSMKSRVCLAELGIHYRSHPIDLIETGAYENIRPAFLAVNPAGTVPVLLHRGHPVYESHEQIRYLADHAPPGSPSLTPPDPELHREMQIWIDRASLTEDPVRQGDESAANAIPGLTLPLFAAMIERLPYWKIGEGLLFHFDRRRPLLFTALKALGLPRFGRLTPAMKLLARSRRQMRAHLDALEAQLGRSGGPWILGAPFSLADVSWLVIFERLVQADCLHVFLSDGAQPDVADYWRRLQERPSYRTAIREHQHPTIEFGTRRLREAKRTDPTLRALLEGLHDSD